MRQSVLVSLRCSDLQSFRNSFSLSNHVFLPSRRSSWSAIHRGLRDSEKSRPQGFKPAALSTIGGSGSGRSTSRSRVTPPGWTAPTYRIRRGKKNITDKGPQPQSRARRFNSPTEAFGKKSLTYQLKRGPLRQALEDLRRSDTEKSDRGSSERPQGRHPRQGNGFESRFGDLESGRPDNRTRNPRDDRRSGRGGGFGSRFSGRGSGRFENRPREPQDDHHSVSGGEKGGFENAFGDRGSGRFQNRTQESRDYRHSAGPRDSSFGTQPMGRNTERGLDRRVSRLEDREEGREDDAEGGRRMYRRERSDRGRSSYEDQGSSRGTDDTIDHGDKEHSRRSFERRDLQRSERLAFREDRDGGPEDQGSGSRRDTSRRDVPIRIHHTTAASQFLYGRSVVEAAIRESSRKLYHLYIYSGEGRQNTTQDTHLARLAEEKKVQVKWVRDHDGLRMMEKMSGGRPHNGCILEASPVPQLPLKGLGDFDEGTRRFSLELAHQSSEDAAINGTQDFVEYRGPRARKPFILLLDGIQDPGNLGAILRTAAFLGVTGVAITKHSSASLTPVALKASAGASELLPLYSVPSTMDFLERSKSNGWLTYAAVPAGPRSRGNSHLLLSQVEKYDPLSVQPSILVVGSEGDGLEKRVRRLANYEVSIPGAAGFMSVIDSLNVSVATAILVSAFLKKSNQGFEIDDPVAGDESETGSEDRLW